ncbi:efflux RND transporter periplasmic adaptor subunit [bacterium]|nr:efflux RND transporter periplasmic adaptor subunit [bacterium]
MNAGLARVRAALRRSVKWLVLACGAALIVYKMEFSPAPALECAVTAGPISAEVLGTGTLEARTKTTISPRIQERLAAVLVDQGDMVTGGQLLARLDDGELRQQVGVAEASLIAARATVDRVRVDEARAKAVEKMMRSDYDRIVNLLATKVSSQAEYDKASEQLSVAEADLRRAQAAIIEAQSQAVMAERNVAHQRERLAFTRLVSPYDGLIVRRDRDPGGIVVPGGSLLQLVSTNQLWISAWVDETAMAGLASGQTARVIFRSEPERAYPGEVVRLGREADRETREFIVDVQVRQLPKQWTVGQRAEVFIETARKPAALVVPLPFLQWRGATPGVFVNERGKAVWRAVTLGVRGQQMIEILRGVSAGDRVLAPREAKQELKHGQRVRVQ